MLVFRLDISPPTSLAARRVDSRAARYCAPPNGATPFHPPSSSTSLPHHRCRTAGGAVKRDEEDQRSGGQLHVIRYVPCKTRSPSMCGAPQGLAFFLPSRRTRVERGAMKMVGNFLYTHRYAGNGIMSKQ